MTSSSVEGAAKPDNRPAVQIIADKVGQLLGGDNANQFFTLLLPGTVIEPTRFAYDINATKPPHVAVAESHLTNQLLDVCRVTASPNGRHLGSQYLAALNTLVPKFSPELTAVKNALRDYLRSSPNYVDENGVAYQGSVQDLYFELFNKWVQKKQDWEAMMQDERRLIAREVRDPQLAEDRFLSWYQTVAEGKLLEMDALMGKVLAFFSPSDMDTILGVLNSGPGGAIEEARRALEDAERPSPDGGKFYPVNLYPTDWFTSLSSDADPTDLLQDPMYIAQRLQLRRTALLLGVNQVKAMIATATPDLAESQAKLDNAQQAYDQKQRDLRGAYGQNLLVAVDVYKALKGADAVPAAGEIGETKQTLDKESERKGEVVEGQSTATTNGDDRFSNAVRRVVDGQKDLVAVQGAFMNSLKTYTEEARRWVVANATSHTATLQPYLARLQTQVEEVESLQAELQAAAAKPASPPPALAQVNTTKAGASSSSDRFMQVTMAFQASSMSKDTKVVSSSSQADVSVDLFWGSASHSSSDSSADSAAKMLDNSSSVEIGMKMTKVDIDRPWFDPGIFLASSDMSRMSKALVSHGPANLSGTGPARVSAETANEGLFPCYPVSFVLAKDITIRFKVAQSQLDAVKTVVDSRSASGGGFLCFSASRSSASRSERESVNAKNEDGMITIRINSPQIIGWFSQYVPKDMSKQVEQSSLTDATSVLAFIKECTDQLTKGTGALRAITPPPAPALGNGRNVTRT